MKIELLTLSTSMVILLVMIFLFNLILNKVYRKTIEEEKKYDTFNLLKALLFLSFTFGGFYLFDNIHSLNNIAENEFLEEKFTMFERLKFYSFFFGIYIIYYTLMYFITNLIYKLLFDGKELKYILKNDEYIGVISYSIIFFIFIATTIKGVSLICEIFIPYPTMPNFR